MDIGGGLDGERLQDLHPDALPTGERELSEPKVDMEYLQLIVNGVSARREELDASIATHLSSSWTDGRLEALLRAVLRGGAYELRAFPDLPVEVIITEYIALAQDFFSGREPALVNAVLDGIAGDTRGNRIPKAIDDPAPDPSEPAI
jgi:N utilization substance protein B